MSRALVVGYRVAGQAVAHAWMAAGGEAVAVDDGPSDADRRVAAERGIELVVAPDRARLDELAAWADVVVVSPGIPVGHPVYAAAEAAGAEVLSEIELAWRVAVGTGGSGGTAPRPGRQGRPAARLVAITGTNGKTTVTTLVADALVRSGRRAVAAGNIGMPLVDAFTATPTPEVVVAEVSSFQLQFTRDFRPDVSCWLNLTPDHLDWHPTTAHYRAAKERVWSNQGPGDVAVANADDPVVMDAARALAPGVERVTFSTTGPADWWEDATVLRGPEGPLLESARLARNLPHDRANALAAAAVAAHAGATLDGTREALATDLPLPHRVQRVAEGGGVVWYDDSKATTPASVLAAVAGFDSVVLIAGGRNKGLDLGVLAATVPPVRAVVAIGEAAGEVEAAFAGLVPVESAGTMAEAVERAGARSRPGDAVVLSPGCASFDWYRSYGARGDEFSELARTFVGKGGSSVRTS